MIIHQEGDVIYLSGSMTRNHWPTLRSTCSMLLRQYPGGIVVNCDEIGPWNQDGLATLAEAQKNDRIYLAYVPDEIRAALSLLVSAKEPVATQPASAAKPAPLAEKPRHQ